MTWLCWLWCGGLWRPVAKAHGLPAAHRALLAEQRRRGCWQSTHGCLTTGATPSFPPAEARCLSRHDVSPPGRLSASV
jgi:hypothetical protein